MRHMYYHSFPQAPVELVSGISAAAGIPSIVGAYVGKEYNSIFLDVFQNKDFRVKAQHLCDVAEVCGVTLDELEVGPGIDDDHLSITLETSCFDFSRLVEGPYAEYTVTRNRFYHECELPGCLDNLPGIEDSEESIEAHVKTANRN